MENNTNGTGLGDGNSFKEEAQTYLMFIIGTYIDIYWFPILVPIGLIGNTLSFLVMIKPNNRKLSTCIYMAAISINDNFMMFLALHDNLVFATKVHNPYLIECKLSAYFTLLATQNSTFLVLAMTVDKYIAIKWPHKAAVYSTPRRALKTILITCIFVLIYNIPHWYLAKMVRDVCLTYVSDATLTKVYSWATFVLNAAIPFVLLCSMNCVIVKKVRQSHRMFGGTESAGQNEVQGQDQGQNNVANSKRQNKMKNTENQLIIMLLLVTTLFLILMIPTYIRFLYTSFVEGDTPARYAFLVFFFQLSYKLYNTNSAINFFLYCISGHKFRNDLKEILCCSGRASSLTSSKSQTCITELSSSI